MSTEAGKAIANALSNWSLNQNLLSLIASLIALYYGEKRGLCSLQFVGLFLSFIFGLTVIITMIIYTYEYWVRKFWKAKRHILEYDRENTCNKRRERLCKDCKFCNVREEKQKHKVDKNSLN
jgi:ATP/ADP translocase